jgi:DNA mismatch repair protein MutS
MTPLMRQYWDIKSLHEDKILLFRMGDFFEMFFDDAVKAAPILGIALTQRNKKSADETPMCGVPHHSISGPINKLLRAGLKIAICDQVEDPKTAKGLVKRAVTRVLTPGMVYDPDTLEQTVSNYLACWSEGTLACADTSTGEGFYFENLNEGDVRRLLELLPIAEMILENEESATHGFSGLVSFFSQSKNAVENLKAYIVSLGGEESLKTLKPFEARSLQKRLDLSSTVLRHLEIFGTYKGDGEGSFYQAVQRTQTSAGARLLRQWISFPLTEAEDIRLRQDQVERWTNDLPRLKKVREMLSKMGDIERRLGKIAQPQCNGRDLLALAQSVAAGLSALEVAGLDGEALKKMQERFSRLRMLSAEIESTLVEEPPLPTRQGHLIRKFHSKELDELIELSTDSQSMLAKMETEERQKTGISSLKIRYNNVFGYYIEITNTHKEKVPANYLRKQTLANAERFYTDELVELEKKVLTAQTRRFEMEFEIFETLRQKCLAQSSDLLTLASLASELDVITSLAWLALERKYVRPEISRDGSLTLKASRHPVVEQTVKKTFVPNDILISAHGCLLLTGPNMAGKSTLMRQVALAAILHQMGSFVPAEVAVMPLFDHLFTRIGASDQLSEGLSTFMVEMTETAEMVAKSSRRSLLILDEIGRGTSTFDGMALAQSILEFVLTELGAMTLFATHYHELTSLEGHFPGLKNAHMTVSEKQGEIRFLHTLTSGPALKSYGIQVAKLAGLPAAITRRAQGLLQQMESKKTSATSQLSLLELNQEREDDVQGAGSEDLERLKSLEKMAKDLENFPVLKSTPLEAMNIIAKWQEALTTPANRQN